MGWHEDLLLELLNKLNCGGYEYCPYLDTRSRATLLNNIRWCSRHFVGCKTPGIIYLLQCTCGAFYVGKTRREFPRCIYDHVYAGKIGYFKSLIGRHIALDHNYKFEGFKFLPLQRIYQDSRGGDWDQKILQKESRWIFQLRSNLPPGLNEKNIPYRPFL